LITGGNVSNAAGNNLNPAININAPSGLATDPPGVIIEGGTVASTSASGYALQSTGNIQVTGGTISAIDGRAVNLVGLNAIFYITGGTVQATGAGTAISSATTKPQTVTGASVWVAGGTITSNSGSSIQVTGLTSSVLVAGGTITSTSGNAILATADAANASIAVNGTAVVSSGSGNAIYAQSTSTGATSQTVYIDGNAKVSSTSARAIQVNGATSTVTVVSGQVFSNNSSAIQAMGASSSVTVSGSPPPIGPGGPGGQVYVYNAGPAIRSGGTITVSGGFVFAYGTNPATALSAPTINWPTSFSPPGGQVTVWNPAGVGEPYQAGSSTDLVSWVDPQSNATWEINTPLGPGISYSNLWTSGFFVFPKTIDSEIHGLIFDASTGELYEDNGLFTPAPGPGVLWMSVGTDPTIITDTWVLYLNGLTWNTSATNALTIINGDAIIYLINESTNTFISTNTLSSYGIYVDTTSAPSVSLTFGMSDGTIVAQGNTGAFNTGGTTPTLPSAYTWWMNLNPVDPGGMGVPYVAGSLGVQEFPWAVGSKYARITLGPVALIGNDIVSGTVDNMLPSSPDAIITLYGDVVGLNGISGNVNSWFADLPAGVDVTATAAPGSNTIFLSFSGTPLETSNAYFFIIVPGNLLEFEFDVFVRINRYARFNIVNPDPPAWYYGSGPPDTSDRSNIEGWTTSLLLSAVGLLGILVWIRWRKPLSKTP